MTLTNCKKITRSNVCHNGTGVWKKNFLKIIHSVYLIIQMNEKTSLFQSNMCFHSVLLLSSN